MNEKAGSQRRPCFVYVYAYSGIGGVISAAGSGVIAGAGSAGLI